MPLSYTIDREQRRVLACGTGVLTVSDVVAYLRRRIEDPEFEAGFAEILDLTAVSYVDIFAKGMDQILPVAEATRRQRGPAPAAIVAPSDLVYGMARMYSLLAQARGTAVPIGVFRTRAEAEAYLAMPLPTAVCR